MILFYDFEVFKYDWLVCIKSGDSFEVIINNPKRLQDYYKSHINDVWVGYNSAHYDKFIMADIINNERNPYPISFALVNNMVDTIGALRYTGNINLINFDVQGADKSKSLKQLELFMGDSIEESTVPFDIDRPLSASELDEVVRYCKHDVNETEQVFLKRISYFKSHVNLIKTFNLPFAKSMGLTQARLSAEIIGCKSRRFKDEKECSLLDCIKIGKYQDVYDWFASGKHNEPVFTKTGKAKNASLEVMIFGIPHKCGLGGIHGCIPKPIKRDGNILHIDVRSYYPSIMIEHNLLTRSADNPAKYKAIFDNRIALKEAGKDEEQKPFKIVLNSTYGITKDPYSKAYDFRRGSEVCANGQLMLIDLLDKLENAGCCELLQSNTDGIIIQYDNGTYDTIVAICEEWCSRCAMVLEYEPIAKLIQKDVNNYIAVFEDGTVEVVGAMVKVNNALDNNCAIRNIAIRDYLINGKSVWATLITHNDLIDYQICVKRSSKYDRLWVGDTPTDLKTLRVFATTDGVSIGKQKGTGTIERYASTPEKATVYNGCVKNMKCKDLSIDKRWYYEKIMGDLKLWEVE